MRRDGLAGFLLGRVAGVPVHVRPSWIVVSLVLGMAIASPAAGLPGVTRGGSLVLGAVLALLLSASVLVHELAHALVARRRGLTVRGIALVLTGGRTEMSAAETPGTSALVAVAGPLANLAVAAAAWWAWTLDLPLTARLVALMLALASATVAGFNLLPGMPMDGGWILEALVWRITGRRAAGTRAAAWVGRAVAVGLLVTAVVYPLLRGASDLTLVVWSAVIGATLWAGASEHLNAAARRQALDGLAPAALAHPAVGVAAGASAAEVHAAAAGGLEVVLVAPDGTPVGYVDRRALAAVPGERRDATPAGAVVVPLPRGAVVDGALAGRSALDAVSAAFRFSRVLAVLGPDGAVVGLLRYEDVVDALSGRGRVPGT